MAEYCGCDIGCEILLSGLGGNKKAFDSSSFASCGCSSLGSSSFFKEVTSPHNSMRQRKKSI
jgi:hypothetical protein